MVSLTWRSLHTAEADGMDEGTRVWAAATEESLWLRIDGRAMADLCPALRSFCESELSSSRTTLYVDLHGCEHFDSTFLGTLLCLQKVHGKAGGQSVVLVTPAESCHQALKRMGAHLLFPIQAVDPPDQAEWTVISGTQTSRDSQEFRRQVVDAHSQLAAVPGPLGDLYGPIARMAEQEFASR